MIITYFYSRTMKFSTIVCGAAGLLLVAGCAADPSPEGADVTIAASFYPLQYVAQQVAGDNATVVALAQPGVEPHDLELSPSNVRELADADLVLYLAEFQPAIDDAIETTGVHSLDAGSVVTLHSAGHEHGDEAEAEHEDEAEAEHEHGASDPHFWLDPTLLATYAAAVGDELASLDPSNADAYTANAATLSANLTTMDEDFTAGLAQCERDVIVVSHEAFGYLTERYGLEQVGIAGVDPESEPSPARILEIREVVETTGVTTIFTESLINPAVAESIAQDTGATTAVLDPVETVMDDDDYATVMARNLENLRVALNCA